MAIKFDSLEIREYDITAVPSRIKAGKLPQCHYCTDLAPYIGTGLTSIDTPFNEPLCQRHKEECEEAFKNNLPAPKFLAVQSTTKQGDTTMTTTVQSILAQADALAKRTAPEKEKPAKAAKPVKAKKESVKKDSTEPKATTESLFKPILKKGGITVEAFGQIVAKAVQNELKGRISRPAPLLAKKVLSFAKSNWGIKIDEKGKITGKK